MIICCYCCHWALFGYLSEQNWVYTLQTRPPSAPRYREVASPVPPDCRRSGTWSVSPELGQECCLSVPKETVLVFEVAHTFFKIASHASRSLRFMSQYLFLKQTRTGRITLGVVVKSSPQLYCVSAVWMQTVERLWGTRCVDTGIFDNAFDLTFNCEIFGFHGGKYEEGCILGCWPVESGRSLPTFQRCLPPSPCRQWPATIQNTAVFTLNFCCINDFFRNQFLFVQIFYHVTSAFYEHRVYMSNFHSVSFCLELKFSDVSTMHK
jgi:hypothetical protein